MIARFNPPVWIVALSREAAVCQGLAFSYGTLPVQLAEEPENWNDFIRQWLREHQVSGPVAMLVAGPSARNPEANYRLVSPSTEARSFVSAGRKQKLFRKFVTRWSMNLDPTSA